jgi:hypothetical protein
MLKSGRQAVWGKCMREEAGNLISSRIVIFKATIFLPSMTHLRLLLPGNSVKSDFKIIITFYRIGIAVFYQSDL